MLQENFTYGYSFTYLSSPDGIFAVAESTSSGFRLHYVHTDNSQNFNRYAYCMYNPLKYIDPTGERQVGWSPSTYYYEQMARLVVLK